MAQFYSSNATSANYRSDALCLFMLISSLIRQFNYNVILRFPVWLIIYQKSQSFQVAASLDRMTLTSRDVTSFPAVFKCCVMFWISDNLFEALLRVLGFIVLTLSDFGTSAIFMNNYSMPSSRSLRSILNSIGLGEDHLKSP